MMKKLTIKECPMKHNELPSISNLAPLLYNEAGALIDSLKEATLRVNWLQSRGIGTDLWHSQQRADKFRLLANAIGDTALATMKFPNGATTQIKEEFTNPSGSHYDRVYFETIRHLESIGFLQPGDEIRDISSGSAGTSLALIGTLLGYNVRITVPDELPKARLQPMRYFGAEVIRAGAGYVPRASQQQIDEITYYRDSNEWKEARPSDRSCRSLLFSIDDERICYLNHSENDLSPIAFGSIGNEIADTAPDTTHLLLAEGNWTTIAGISPVIRRLLPTTKIVSYCGETTDHTTTNFGTTVPDVPLRFMNESLVDQHMTITDDDRDLMIGQAAHAGRSSLMGLAAANLLLQTTPTAKIVSICYDLANRY